MPTFWIRFYLRQCLQLAASGVALALVFHFSRLDLWLADPWFGRGNPAWAFRNAWWAKTLIHSWFKGVLILAALATLWTAWRHRKAGDARRWRLVGTAVIVVPLVVSLWKHFSSMHCPWDIARYGGTAPYLDLFASVPAPLVGVGRCFPAGFVSTGGWMLAFALLRFPEDRRFSRQAALGAVALCLFLGSVQQMRGAHFLSHVLWTLWLSWAVVLVLHALLGVWRTPSPGA